jgi:hypothetical protein
MTSLRKQKELKRDLLIFAKFSLKSFGSPASYHRVEIGKHDSGFLSNSSDNPKNGRKIPKHGP